MYVRALIVVLAILNAGVALWWAARPAASPPPPPAVAAGVASLQLLPSAPAVAPDTPAPAPAPAPPAAAPTGAPPSVATRPVATSAPAERCLSFGPWPGQASAEAVRNQAGALLQAARVREVAEASSFRVMLAGVGDKAAAQAAVARIKAAGLSDYYLVGNGGQYDVALGQYRNRQGAERRQAELAAAGIQAAILPSGGAGTSRWWIDARTRADDTALRALHAPGQRTLDCAALR